MVLEAGAEEKPKREERLSGTEGGGPGSRTRRREPEGSHLRRSRKEGGGRGGGGVRRRKVGLEVGGAWRRSPNKLRVGRCREDAEEMR